MCMKKLYNIYRQPLPEVEIGYKYFDDDSEDGKLYPPARSSFGPLKIGVWIHDTSVKGITMSYGNNRPSFNRFDKFGNIVVIQQRQIYPTGFHIFKTLKDAKLYGGSGGKIFKVKYKNVVADGEQNGKCVIARSMLIIPGQRK